MEFVNSVWSETDDFYSRFYRDEIYLFNHTNFLGFFPIYRDRICACFAAVWFYLFRRCATLSIVEMPHQPTREKVKYTQNTQFKRSILFLNIDVNFCFIMCYNIFECFDE
jgi:hypothetical protein